MSIQQAVIAASSGFIIATSPGGEQPSIPEEQVGLWRLKANGEVSNDDPTWFGLHQNLVTSSYNTVQYIGTDVNDTTQTFSLEFKGYFKPSATGIYRFRTNSDDGSWLWIGTAAIDPTTENANVKNGGAHGPNYAVGGNVKLTQNLYYPIRVLMWDGGGGWILETEWSSYVQGLGWSSWSNDFGGQIFYNGATYGF